MPEIALVKPTSRPQTLISDGLDHKGIQLRKYIL